MSGKILNLNFTDSTKSTIDLSPATINGPSGGSRLLDIDLLGIGHSLWGDAILENILHILENFACGEDIHAITAIDTGAGTITLSGNVINSFLTGTTFDVFDSDNNNGTWTVSTSGYSSGSDTTTVTVVESLSSSSTLGNAGHLGWPNKSLSYSPINPTEGQIWYNQTRSQMFVYYVDNQGSPVSEYWKRLEGITISDTEPTSPSEGDLWWETTTYATSSDQYGRNLQIYISGSWVRIVENYLPRDGSKTVTGILNMGANRIENLADPNSGDDAVNLTYADNRYVNVTGDTMTGILNMGANKIENVADPDSGDDAVNLTYADNRYVNVTGDTMTGILNMGANRIENLADPNSGDDAVNLTYADNRYVNVTGDTMTGILTLSADPTTNLHAATKQYVDNTVSAGFNPVRGLGYNVEAIAYRENVSIQSYGYYTTMASFTAGQSGNYRIRVRVAGYTDNRWRLYKNSTLLAEVINSHGGFWTYDRYLSYKTVSLSIGDVLYVKVNTTHSSARAYGCWIHILTDFTPLSSWLHSGTTDYSAGGLLEITPLDTTVTENNTLSW